MSLIGTHTQKYLLYLCDAHNIRFKFKITEDLLNKNKAAEIFRANGVVLRSTIIPLYQYTTTYLDDLGVEQTSFYPAFRGGLMLSGQGSGFTTKQLVGEFAFSVQYTGDLDNDVTMENSGLAFILKVNNSEVANFNYSTYTTVESLYEAIKALSDFDIDYNEIESRLTSEIAIFQEVKLTSTYRSVIDGGYDTPNSEGVIYRDSGKFHIPYSIYEGMASSGVGYFRRKKPI